jgi:hypothetical protein
MTGYTAITKREEGLPFLLFWIHVVSNLLLLLPSCKLHRDNMRSFTIHCLSSDSFILKKKTYEKDLLCISYPWVLFYQNHFIKFFVTVKKSFAGEQQQDCWGELVRVLFQQCDHKRHDSCIFLQSKKVMHARREYGFYLLMHWTWEKRSCKEMSWLHKRGLQTTRIQTLAELSVRYAGSEKGSPASH